MQPVRVEVRDARSMFGVGDTRHAAAVHRPHGQEVGERLEIFEDVECRVGCLGNLLAGRLRDLALEREGNVRRKTQRVGTRPDPHVPVIHAEEIPEPDANDVIAPRPDRRRRTDASEAELSREYLPWRWRFVGFVALDYIEIERLVRPV